MEEGSDDLDMEEEFALGNLGNGNLDGPEHNVNLATLLNSGGSGNSGFIFQNSELVTKKGLEQKSSTLYSYDCISRKLSRIELPYSVKQIPNFEDEEDIMVKCRCEGFLPGQLFCIEGDRVYVVNALQNLYSKTRCLIEPEKFTNCLNITQSAIQQFGSSNYITSLKLTNDTHTDSIYELGSRDGLPLVLSLTPKELMTKTTLLFPTYLGKRPIILALDYG